MNFKLNYTFGYIILIGLVTACGNSNQQKSAATITEIGEAAAIRGVNGITFGPDGNLYIASVFAGEIMVLNKETGEIINRIGADAKVIGPDDLIFGPDGSLYWTDISAGEVGRRTSDGVVTKQFVAIGVNPITFSDDGRLFVALDFDGDGFFELDPMLIEPPRHIIASSPENPMPLGYLNAFDFGPDGKLYGPVFTKGTVVQMELGKAGDPVSLSPYTDGSVKVIAEGFINTVAVKFSPSGVMHVLDQTGEVFQVDHLTGEKTKIGTLDPGLDNLAFDSEGRLFISCADFGSIVELLEDGEVRVVSKSGMISPQGLAVMLDANGADDVFVADIFRLRQLDGQSGDAEHIYKGHLFYEEGKLTLSSSVSLDAKNLVISSWMSNLVQVWNPEKDEVIEEYAIPFPFDAVRLNDDLAVISFGLGGVVWAKDQSPILAMDSTSVVLPSGLATDGKHLWVSDWGTGIVWRIEFDGKKAKAPVQVASGLSQPEGIAFDLDGNLIVVETGKEQISRISLDSGEISMIAEGLNLNIPASKNLPPIGVFNGVAVGGSGTIYTAGGTGNIIYKLTEN